MLTSARGSGCWCSKDSNTLHFVCQDSGVGLDLVVCMFMFFYRARPYVAGVALMALGGALVLVLVARDAAALCVAGVSLGDIYVRFTWQAWRNVTSTFVLRGRRGTYGTGWRAWAGFSRP